MPGERLGPSEHRTVSPANPPLSTHTHLPGESGSIWEVPPPTLHEFFLSVCLLLFFNISLRYFGFPGGTSGKEPANAGDLRDMGSVLGLGRSPGRRARQPTPVFLPGKFHQQRSLESSSPWGRKESDTTEAT